jgi:hypothetical protein
MATIKARTNNISAISTSLDEMPLAIFRTKRSTYGTVILAIFRT